MSLTESGEALFERARGIVEDMAEVEAIASSAALQPRGLLRINAPLTFGVLHLAPPPGEGWGDPRTRALARSFRLRSSPAALVYGSTSGVYGDCGGALIDETRKVAPHNGRALRRVDAEQVLREIRRQPGVVYSALVPNVRGAERAVESRADELNLVMSASESHNRSNLRMTRDTSFAGLAEVTRAVQGTGVAINVSLSCAFGCPMEGDVPVQSVLDWCQRYVQELGAHGVTLCDTTGMAHPAQVTRMAEALPNRFESACTADRWSSKTRCESNRRRPISVLLPSSTLPQVRKRSSP